MTDPTWLSYECSRPQQDLPVIIRCPGRNGESYHEIVIVPRDLPPESNIANLRWRPTGVFTELGGRVDEYVSQADQQANALGFGSGFCGLLGSIGATGLGARQLSREEYDSRPGENLKWL